jgi:hypothetical protein
MLDKAQAIVSGVIVAGVVAVINSDVVAEQGGSGCETGGWDMSWGVLGGVERLLGLCLVFCGEESHFVECTMRSDEHVRTTSCNAVSRAVDCHRTFVMAGLTVLVGSVAIWVLAVAQIDVSELVAAGVVVTWQLNGGAQSVE